MADPHESTSIKTASGVIDALGGTMAAARLAQSVPQVMTNARAKNRLPYPSFLLLTAALAEVGKTADPRLWGIKPAPSDEERRDGQ
ncbi:MAG: hypothetical protein WA418_29030 [Bradyrhizobium sp.]